MFNPKVSIIIPVYNGSNYLAEAIESALAQTYKNIEILVINDGSTDGGETEKIALSYGDRIRYFPKENGGVATALNFGIAKAEWEYISWLSHDDLYLPTKVEEQVNFIRNLANKDIILFSNVNTIGSKWQLISEKSISLEKINTGALLYNLFFSHPINWCTLLIPKIVFKDVWDFNKDLRTTQDYDMWFRMLSKYEFVKFDKPLVLSRTHDEQDSRNASKFIMMMSEEVKTYGNALKEAWIKKIFISSWLWIFEFSIIFSRFYIRTFVVLRIFVCIWKFEFWKKLISKIRGGVIN